MPPESARRLFGFRDAFDHLVTVGIKDMGATIPGHGGILDRFISMLLVAPAVFHYVRYLNGIAVGQPERIIL